MCFVTFRSIPGVYLLDASSTPPPSCDDQKCILTRTGATLPAVVNHLFNF